MKPHYQASYQWLVGQLLARHSHDEAMSLAVGGDYEKIGSIEADILQFFGLRGGMAVIDFGCGSGRFANAISKRVQINYLGIDVVQTLLDYAKSKTPLNYSFVLSSALQIPAPDSSADFVAAFSVFTHLLPSESFLYLEDFKRVLRPGGKIIFSFLEFSDPNHWGAFMNEVGRVHDKSNGQMNTLIERSVVELWARRLGYNLEAMIGGHEAPWGGEPLGQSTVVLRKL